MGFYRVAQRRPGTPPQRAGRRPGEVVVAFDAAPQLRDVVALAQPATACQLREFGAALRHRIRCVAQEFRQLRDLLGIDDRADAVDFGEVLHQPRGALDVAHRQRILRPFGRHGHGGRGRRIYMGVLGLRIVVRHRHLDLGDTDDMGQRLDEQPAVQHAVDQAVARIG